MNTPVFFAKEKQFEIYRGIRKPVAPPTQRHEDRRAKLKEKQDKRERDW